MGRNMSTSTPRDQMRVLVKPWASNSRCSVGRRHHHRPRRAVEPAQETVDRAFGHEGQARVHIFGKARVEGGREGDVALEADGARAQPQRAFGGDVDRVGREIVDHRLQAFARKHRQADFGIGRQGQGEAALRRGIAHLMAQRGQVLAQDFERAHDAVDLRRPGIGDDQDAFMRAGCATGRRGVASDGVMPPASPTSGGNSGLGRACRRVRSFRRERMPSGESPCVRAHLRQGLCSFQPSRRHCGR